MKNLHGFSCFFIFLFSTHFVFAQNPPIAIGQWRQHISYNKATVAAEGNNGIIYCASRAGMFSYQKDNHELTLYSHLNGLSDVEISTINFDKATGTLLIAYENSNIDLISSDKTIYNLPDIKQKNIIGGKHINNIFFLNGEAYISCEFGIVVIDMTRKEVKDTYYINPNNSYLSINGLAFDGTYLLAVSDSGVFKANYNDPNIFNFTAWTKETSLVQPDANYTSATFLNNRFYIIKSTTAGDSVFVQDNNVWQVFLSDNTTLAKIKNTNNKLVYINNGKIALCDESGNILRSVFNWDYTNGAIRDGFMDSDNNFWIADNNNGLVKQSSNFSIEVISPNGPRSEAVWAMQSRNGKLWVASGALEADHPDFNIKSGIYYFSDNHWNTFDLTNDAVYSQAAANSPAVICVAIDPNDPEHAFIGNWGSGLLEFRNNGGVTIYNESNSSIRSIDPNYIIVGGVTFDDDGNLWVVSGGNTNSISVRKPDGVWQSFVIPDVTAASYGLYKLIVDDYGQKWFIARGGASAGAGVCVFKENDINSASNNQFKILTDRSGNGALPDIFVRDLAKDKDGSVWLGTNKGVAVIYNPGSVFSGGNYDAERIIIEQDGHAQYLLETEIVTSVVIDGANRKWFGTFSGGVFLMSSDGTKQLLNFNTANSPLPSNLITSIAIDDLTGEVFFGTDKGIISYRGDATEGQEECKNTFVFPNPVMHEYNGPVAIRGLVGNSDVKITDIAGNLVYHTIANGGEAIWNGTNFKGERAQTGIYTVFVTNEDGTQTCVTKMLFAN
jgi:ligand-binding sensor domain-containing protein